MERTLYHFENCPHCEKVRIALKLENLTWRSVEIDPADRSEVRKVSGQGKVPVLVEEDGSVLNDSNRILRHLANRQGSRLLPEGRRERALAWVVVDRANSVLGPLTRHLSLPADGVAWAEGDLLETRRDLERELAHLESLLERGPYFFGEHPTVPDIVAFAFLSRFRKQTGQHLPATLPLLSAWYGHVEAASAGA
jgi:glutathione S-transferase